MSEVLDDPLAQLQRMAQRQTLETEAAKSLAKARVKLVLGKDARCVFFASLALRLQLNPTGSWRLRPPTAGC